MTLHKVLSDYYAYKCDDSVEDKALKTRIERTRKYVVTALGKNRVWSGHLLLTSPELMPTRSGTTC